MRMLCYKCDHSWPYKGKHTEEEDYITCPGCYRKILLGKALIEDPSEQKLLTSLPKKSVKTTSFPSKLLTTTHFERVILDGFVYLVDKKIAKQFKEAPDELEEDGVEDMQEQEPSIKILSPSLPTQIQKAFYEKEQEQNNPFLNPPREEPNFEINIIPIDHIKILEHQRSFSLR